jgi:hypothetical protein
LLAALVEYYLNSAGKEEEAFRTRKFTVTAQAYISLSQKRMGACCAGGTGPPSTIEDERVAGNVGYLGMSTGKQQRVPADEREMGWKGKERHGSGSRIRSSRCGSDKVRAEMKAPTLTEQLLMQTVKFSQWTVNFSMRSRLRIALFSQVHQPTRGEKLSRHEKFTVSKFTILGRLWAGRLLSLDYPSLHPPYS